MKKVLIFLFVFLYGCSWFIGENKFSLIYLWYIDQFDVDIFKISKQNYLNEKIDFLLTWNLNWYTWNMSLNLNNFYQDDENISSNILFSWILNDDVYQIDSDMLFLSGEKYIFPKVFNLPKFEESTKQDFLNTRWKINNKKDFLDKIYIYLCLKSFQKVLFDFQKDLKINPILKENWLENMWYNIKINKQNYFDLQEKYKLLDLNLIWNLVQNNSWFILNMNKFEFGNFWGSGTIWKNFWKIDLFSKNLEDNKYFKIDFDNILDKNYNILIYLYNLDKEVWKIKLDIVKVYLEKWMEIDIKGELKIEYIDIKFVLKYTLFIWNENILKWPEKYQDIEEIF